MLVTVIYDSPVPHYLKEALKPHETSFIKFTGTPETLTATLVSQPNVVLPFLRQESPSVVALLKDFGIPYTGSDARTLLLTANQRMLDTTLLHEGILVGKPGTETVTGLIYGNPFKVLIEGGNSTQRETAAVITETAARLLEVRDYCKFLFSPLTNTRLALTEVDPSFCLVPNASLLGRISYVGTSYANLLTSILTEAISRSHSF